MRICFLVLTHKAPVHFGRLVATLTESGRHSVITHVDARVDDGPFRAAAPAGPAVTFLTDRFKIYWGGFSMIEATLALLERGRATAPDADYYWLISGDSYPLRSVPQIEQFLAAHPDAQYLDFLPFPHAGTHKPLRRMSHYWIEHDPRTNRLSRLYKTFYRLAPKPYRRALGGMTPYSGSQWITLSAACTDHVLAETARRPEFVRLARTSQVPDEFYFQTLVGNSGFRSGLRPGLMYAEFPPVGPRPALISRDHIDRLQAQRLKVSTPYGERDVLMGRKLVDSSAGVQDEIEKVLWD